MSESSPPSSVSPCPPRSRLSEFIGDRCRPFPSEAHTLGKGTYLLTVMPRVVWQFKNIQEVHSVDKHRKWEKCPLCKVISFWQQRRGRLWGQGLHVAISCIGHEMSSFPWCLTWSLALGPGSLWPRWLSRLMISQSIPLDSESEILFASSKQWAQRPEPMTPWQGVWAVWAPGHMVMFTKYL